MMLAAALGDHSIKAYREIRESCLSEYKEERPYDGLDRVPPARDVQAETTSNPGV